MSNILDKVIASESLSEARNVHWQSITETLLSPLTEKEKEILSLRYGFRDMSKKTLEEIGNLFQVTRERVRQMIKASIQKIEHILDHEHLESIDHRVVRELERFGGIISKKRLFSSLTMSEQERMIFEFLLTEITHRYFHTVVHERFIDTLQLTGLSLESFHRLIERIHEFLSKNPATKITEILSHISGLDHFQEIISTAGIDMQPELLLENILEGTRGVSQSVFGHWGFSRHPLITPKRMRDKIFLVLKRTGAPLHFRAIAEEINTSHFDNKKAYAPTIHNELILDKRFVLVGRGMYALAEWGYSRGVVRDLITDIIKKRGPLTRKEIESNILQQRFVKPGTIYLALSNKQLFQKDKENGRYMLATESPLPETDLSPNLSSAEMKI